MIVVVLVIGAGLGWLVRSARIQREAIAAIKRAGGSVEYNWEWGNGKIVKSGNPWASKWLTDRVGIDYFGRVTAVSFYLPYFSERPPIPFAAVGHLNQLETLLFDGQELSDDGLSNLKDLKNLTELDLSFCFVTDAELANLSGLKSLKSLHLQFNLRFTDAGLAHLKGLTKLTLLDLRHTQVTDAGLAHLTGLAKLTSLDVRGTKVTDAGVKELQQALPSLKITR